MHFQVQIVFKLMHHELSWWWLLNNIEVAIFVFRLFACNKKNIIQLNKYMVCTVQRAYHLELKQLLDWQKMKWQHFLIICWSFQLVDQPKMLSAGSIFLNVSICCFSFVHFKLYIFLSWTVWRHQLGPLGNHDGHFSQFSDILRTKRLINNHQ